MANDTQKKRAFWAISGEGEHVYTVAHARATVRGDSTVDADLTRIEQKLDSGGKFTVTTAVLNVDAWQDKDGETAVYAVIPVTGATPSTVPLIIVDPDCAYTAIQCGLKSVCSSDDGTITLYAQQAPVDIIEITIVAMFAQSVETDVEVSRPDTPVITVYKLPVATRDTLGGVKIGKNIEIAEDGTISAEKAMCNHVLSGGLVDTDHTHTDKCLEDFVLSSDEVDDVLNSALGIDAQP